MENDLELRHLQQTILALREELERARLEEREHAQREIRQLRESIMELREQLEIREAQFEEKLRKIELQNDHEKSDLHQTIAKLRESLEDFNEGAKKTGEPA